MEAIIINRFPDWYCPGFNEESWNNMFRSSNVIINSDVYDAEFPEHWGPLSLKFAFNGCEYYETENCKYRVCEGNFLLMNQDQIYRSSLNSETFIRSFSINFSLEFQKNKFSDLLSKEDKLLDDPFYSVGSNTNFFSKLYTLEPEIINEVSALKNYLDQLNYNSFYINERLSNILELIYKINCRTFRKAADFPTGKLSTKIETFRRLTKAKDFIESNFQDEITLEKLSLIACMNPFHFLRKFKEFFGKTPHSFLTEVRLREAENLLKNKKFNITDVCISVGFNDLGSFSKLFKRYFQLSPEQYRKAV